MKRMISSWVIAATPHLRRKYVHSMFVEQRQCCTPRPTEDGREPCWYVVGRV